MGWVSIPTFNSDLHSRQAMSSWKQGKTKWFRLVVGIGIHLSIGTILFWKNSLTNP